MSEEKNVKNKVMETLSFEKKLLTAMENKVSYLERKKYSNEEIKKNRDILNELEEFNYIVDSAVKNLSVEKLAELNSAISGKNFTTNPGIKITCER